MHDHYLFLTNHDALVASERVGEYNHLASGPQFTRGLDMRTQGNIYARIKKHSRLLHRS